MGKNLRVGEFLLAVQGLALHRNLFSGTDAQTNARISEIGEIVTALMSSDAHESLSVSTSELSAIDGYRRWAAQYEAADNPLIATEEPALRSVLASVPIGRALDVCCGTGRVSRILRDLGHTVIGIDQSIEMLQVARSQVSGVSFQQEELISQTDTGRDPTKSDYDLITCALALTHAVDLTKAVAAIAARLRPGGRLVITDVHPFFTALDSQAFFRLDDGATSWVRNQHHRFSSYLQAFRAAGLAITDCLEIEPPDGTGPMESFVAALRPDAARCAYRGLPTVILWQLENQGSPEVFQSRRRASESMAP